MTGAQGDGGFSPDIPGEGRRRGGEGGFTVVEVLIALLVLMIGMAGLLSLQLTSMKATGFSRHATEASILLEDKMEDLRTMPVTSTRFVDDSDQVDSLGVPDTAGLYTREWTLTAVVASGLGTASGLVSTGNTDTTTMSVSVSWDEQGAEPYTIRMTDVRTGIAP